MNMFVKDLVNCLKGYLQKMMEEKENGKSKRYGFGK